MCEIYNLSQNKGKTEFCSNEPGWTKNMQNINAACDKKQGNHQRVELAAYI